MTWASLLIELLFVDIYLTTAFIVNHLHRTSRPPTPPLAPGENTVVS